MLGSNKENVGCLRRCCFVLEDFCNVFQFCKFLKQLGKVR